MSFMFEKLDVYQKAVDFADDIVALADAFPRGYGFLVDQLNRAALSIATNLAEGIGRFAKADRRNCLGTARDSAREYVPLLELATRRSLITADQHAILRSNLDEIAKVISGLISGLNRCAD